MNARMPNLIVSLLRGNLIRPRRSVSTTDARNLFGNVRSPFFAKCPRGAYALIGDALLRGAEHVAGSLTKMGWTTFTHIPVLGSAPVEAAMPLVHPSKVRFGVPVGKMLPFSCPIILRLRAVRISSTAG